MKINIEVVNIVSDLKSSLVNELPVFYYGKTSPFEKYIKLWFEELSLDEKQKALKFSNESDRNTYIVSHSLIRRKLTNFLSLAPELLEIKTGERGKPYIGNNCGLSFNLSHKRDRFAFIIAEKNQNPGIDIEEIKFNATYRAVARNYLSESEYFYLQKIIDKQSWATEFLKLWTRREALLKALGIGIITDLKNIVVNEGKRTIEIAELNHNPETFYIKTFLFNNTCISIALTVNTDAFFISLPEPDEV